MLDKLPLDICDACVIDDGPEAIVVALRIQKSTIRENHGLLAALARRSGDKLAIPVSLRAPAKLARETYLKVCALSAGVACIIIFSAGVAGGLRSPPLSSVYADPPVVVNGTLRIEVIAHRTRICETTVDRIIENADWITVWSMRQNGIGLGVTDDPVSRIILVDLPAGMRPGRYYFRAFIHSDCGHFDSHHLVHPRAAFHIKYTT